MRHIGIIVASALSYAFALGLIVYIFFWQPLGEPPAFASFLLALTVSLSFYFTSAYKTAQLIEDEAQRVLDSNRETNDEFDNLLIAVSGKLDDASAEHREFRYLLTRRAE